jgi:hypothetical protein
LRLARSDPIRQGSPHLQPESPHLLGKCLDGRRGIGREDLRERRGTKPRIGILREQSDAAAESHDPFERRRIDRHAASGQFRSSQGARLLQDVGNVQTREIRDGAGDVPSRDHLHDYRLRWKRLHDVTGGLHLSSCQSGIHVRSNARETCEIARACRSMTGRGRHRPSGKHWSVAQTVAFRGSGRRAIFRIAPRMDRSRRLTGCSRRKARRCRKPARTRRR